jgi:cytochrome c biogenesis protein CcdA
MLSASYTIELQLISMNTLLHRKSTFTEYRTLGSERGVKVSEKHALALLGFFTTTGLLSVVAAVFTNTVPMPAGLRDICLIICVITFGLLVIGITLFFLSYKSNPIRRRR